MAENLNLDYKLDGSSYGSCTNSDSGATYGRYYTWGAAMDSAGIYSEDSKGCGSGTYCTMKTPARGICPEGWHIPTIKEWSTLYTAIGKSRYNVQAKGYPDWPDATDAYGFSALPAGDVFIPRQLYYNVGTEASFWIAEESDDAMTVARTWEVNADGIGSPYLGKSAGRSVRCIKNAE